MLRLSRIKYEDNDLTFVDLRVFQGGYDADGEKIYHPTSRGLQIRECDFLKLVEAHVAASGARPLTPEGRIH